MDPIADRLPLSMSSPLGLDRTGLLQRTFEPSERTRQRDFAAILARGQTSAAGTPEAQAREQAEQFVAITLVQPVLKQLRESNNAAPPFAPSQGEKQFQSLMDAHVAQQITRATSFPLVDRLAQDLLRHVKTGAEGAPGKESA